MLPTLGPAYSVAISEVLESRQRRGARVRGPSSVTFGQESAPCDASGLPCTGPPEPGSLFACQFLRFLEDIVIQIIRWIRTGVRESAKNQDL